MRQLLARPLNHRLSIHLNRGGEAGGNVSPTLFLSVVSVCLAAALIAVPFGKVTIVAGSAALATAGVLPSRHVSLPRRFCCVGFLCCVTGFVRGCLRAARCRQNGAAAKASQ